MPLPLARPVPGEGSDGLLHNVLAVLVVFGHGLVAIIVAVEFPVDFMQDVLALRQNLQPCDGAFG